MEGKNLYYHSIPNVFVNAKSTALKIAQSLVQVCTFFAKNALDEIFTFLKVQC